MKKTKTIGLLLLLCSVVMAGGEREKFTLHSKGSDSAPVVFESNEADGSFELVNKSGVLQIKTLGNKDVLITGVKDGGQETANKQSVDIAENPIKVGPYCLPALKIIKGSTGGGDEGTFDGFLEGWNEAVNAGQLYAVWMDLSNQIKGVVFDDSDFITKSGNDGKEAGQKLAFDGGGDTSFDAETYIVSSDDGKLNLYADEIVVDGNHVLVFDNQYPSSTPDVWKGSGSCFIRKTSTHFDVMSSGKPMTIHSTLDTYVGSDETLHLRSGNNEIDCNSSKLTNVAPADLPQF